MSATDHDREQGAPIAPGSALARALDAYAVPDLSDGFADRVLAAAEARPSPLPDLRRTGGGGGGAGRWRLGRRIAIGVTCFGALATAAAASGLLERAGLPVPSPERVWASLSGKEIVPQPVAASAPAAPPPADPAPVALAPVRIEGAIDTPEELAEAFRRIDEVRKGRMEQRRALIDRRIAEELERRRAAGLPVPTPEEEASARARMEEARSRREGLIAERIARRRAELEGRVEAGEALTREDIFRPLREDRRALERRERIERLQRMTPEQRRDALRRLPPEQRRELMEAWRARREARLREGVPASVDVPAPEQPASETDGPAAPEAQESPAPLSPYGTQTPEPPR
ncbi:MAG: hypothetical protein GC147_14105 [Porphyrobacter sp.]|nr:hypothetical protein [Porphyrobacter sp.]